MTKMPPKHRKTYGKSLRRIAKRLGLRFVKTKKAASKDTTP